MKTQQTKGVKVYDNYVAVDWAQKNMAISRISNELDGIDTKEQFLIWEIFVLILSR